MAVGAWTGVSGWWRRALAWLLSLIVVIGLAGLILLHDTHGPPQEESVTLREVQVSLPPPPEPPPPIKLEAVESDVTPTIDLVGPGSGPTMTFSDNPKLALENVKAVRPPRFDLERVDLSRSLAVNFPLLEVKELDQVPRLVSSNRISFPKELRQKGVKRVETKVEIIIDQTGKAFVKKIIDPVYPEMIEVIRKAINDSTFTVPKKNGQPVQAIYLYNLVFINRV